MAGTPGNTTNQYGSFNLLTSRNGEVPEYCVNGKPINAGAIYTIVETGVDYTQLAIDDLIFATATLTVTLLDPSTASQPITVRSIAGTTTITAAAGTVEQASLTVGQSVQLAPRSTGWFII